MLHSCLCKVLGDPGFNTCCSQFSFTLSAFSARSANFDERSTFVKVGRPRIMTKVLVQDLWPHRNQHNVLSSLESWWREQYKPYRCTVSLRPASELMDTQ